MKKKSNRLSKSSNKKPKSIMGFLDGVLGDKGPLQFPSSTKDWLAEWVWLFALIGAIVWGVLLLITIPAVFGLGSTLSGQAAAAGNINFFFTLGLELLFLVVRVILLVIAIPWLKEKKYGGWFLIFLAEIVLIASYLSSFNIIAAIASGIIGFYFLFQIRSRFNK